MIFLYKAKKNLKEVVEGKIDGGSVEQVLEDLQAKGLVPISVEPLIGPPVSAAASAKTSPKPETVSNPIGKWGLKNLVLFTQKLYNLVNSRVELLSALRLLEKDCQNQTEKLLLSDIIKNIKDGVSFSNCLSRYPQYFPQFYVNIVHTGEATGKLKDSLIQLLDYLRRFEDLRTKVKQALAYPIFMTLVGVGTIFVMLTFVLPRLAGMFEDFQAQLPLPTLILLNIANFLKAYWVFVIGFIVILVFAFKVNGAGKESVFSRLKYHIPIAKDIVYKQSVANFSRSLSLLLQSGVNLLSALADAGPIIGNPVYVSQLEQVRRDISQGMPFSDSLAKFKIFPDFFVQMIRVGEEGGRLDSVLADIAESYEKEIEADLKVVSSLIEPAIILVLGLVIGAMVIAMLLPIFNMNSLVGG
ncbi:MAG: type II secretion system F family protein [Candidatus Omnitrophica bacterium]|nr:type II secretion system F family protein [Candidatus Omnitrophota bacterium]